MWVDRVDLRGVVQLARWSLRIAAAPPPLPGKYSLAQKLIHHAFTLVCTATIVTGGLMLVKIDTPGGNAIPTGWGGHWGVIYVIHDLAALLLITMVMTHVYFACGRRNCTSPAP